MECEDGVTITPELVLKAYAYGVFPMAKSRNDTDVFWVQPKLRGVIPLNQFHLSRSLRRTMRRGTFRVTVDTDFARVMEGCAESKEGRLDTWINDHIMELFIHLHEAGLAHSVEVWRDDADGRPLLVGGLYGLAMGSAFFGESMFSRVTDASKVALTSTLGRGRSSTLITCLPVQKGPGLRIAGGGTTRALSAAEGKYPRLMVARSNSTPPAAKPAMRTGCEMRIATSPPADTG